MATEIERKFLVTGDGWREVSTPCRIRQGYLCAGADKTVRVRIDGERAFLTIKGGDGGLVRAEFEYAIPVGDATLLLDSLCERPLIEKTRHVLTVAGWEWVVDEFHGDNAGLLIAEVELTDAAESFVLPDWAGAEVTGDRRYYNASLVRCPYRSWRDGAR